MKKFKVYLTYYAEIEVNAETEEDAQNRPERLLSNNTELLQKCTTSIDFCAGCEEMESSIALIWSIEDVHEIRPDLSDEQAMHVLKTIQEKHDGNLGVNWDVLNFWADELYPKEN